MSMADKRRKMRAQREAEPTPAPAPKPAGIPPRASIMVLAAAPEVEAQQPERNLHPHPEAAPSEEPLVPESSPAPVPEPSFSLELPQEGEAEVVSAFRRAGIAAVRPRVPAERLGATLDKLLSGLEQRGVERHTIRLTIPYSLRVDRELYAALHGQAGSAASIVHHAFMAAPRENLEAIAGAASLVSERRRRPTKGGLGMAGTVTVTLDGKTSETLEVLARRSGLSCGAFLEGCVLIWAAGQGYLGEGALT